ncbi:MAG: hypothetical protein JRG93_04365, partial [Deltaproteobacteria bacterium]|nr:hypothetical protein [Deltaproteobacteria bacterium]
MRVNGVSASRAILESGDVLELGEVRFRFVPSQGAHSLEPLPHEEPETRSSSSSRKPLFAISVIALLVVAAAGAVLATMRGAPGALSMDESAAPSDPRGLDESLTEQEDSDAADSERRPIEEPREWEGQLVRAGEALKKGRLDRAYSIANELPADSVLRKTPEFGEIRYRYAQAHINEAERALEEGDRELARREATLVLELPSITSKQRRDARRLVRRAQGRRIVD